MPTRCDVLRRRISITRRLRVALWQPSTAAIVVTVVFLVGHEILYHLTAGDDYPLVLLTIDGHEILPISHGGLDSIGTGLLIVFVLLLIERAQLHVRKEPDFVERRP